MSLKVVKFDTKMYFDFSNFRGRTSAGGGTSLGPKTGTSVGWGIDKIFTGWGDPQVPPGKNPVTPILTELHWLPVDQHIQYYTGCFDFPLF